MNRLTIGNLPSVPFSVTESINQLRVNLGFCGNNIKVIMVTSSVPNEGKSFVSLYLWKSIAESGHRVLLIDCDLRNSHLRTKYEMKSDQPLEGMVHFLSGRKTLQDSIYKTNVTHGYILPVNTMATNPTLLLENERLGGMIATARDSFDYVIVDTPPLNSVADALNVANFCDGNLLVIGSGTTPRKLVSNSMNLLNRTGKPFLGVVLNKVDSSAKSGSYYSSYSSYGYGYGEKGRRVQDSKQAKKRQAAKPVKEPAAPPATEPVIETSTDNTSKENEK